MIVSEHGRLWVCVALVMLTTLAFVERWIGLGFLLPHTHEADTAMVHFAAFHDRPAGMKANDAVYPSTVYPLLFPRILIALPGSNYPVAQAADAPLAAHLAAASEPYMRARRLIALLSLLVIPCTYWLARRWLEPSWAVFAAALVATSELELEFGQIAKPHGGLAGFTALAFVGIVALVRSRTLAAYLFAGTATALALGSLNSGCFLLPSLVLAHYFGWRNDRDKKRWTFFALALGICAALFAIAYPYILFGGPARPGDEKTFNFGQQAIPWESWGLQGFRDMLPAMFGHDPTLVVSVLLGIAVLVWAMIRGRITMRSALWPEALVLGLCVVIFIVLFGLHERFCARYLLPILPCFALLGAFGVREISGAIGAFFAGDSLRRWIGVALAIGVLAFPAYVSVRLATLRTRDDTPTLAARWIEKNIPQDSGAIALDFILSLPLLQGPEGLKEVPAWSWQPWQRYQMQVMPTDVRGNTWNLRQLFEPRMLADHRIVRQEVLDRLEKVHAKWAVVAIPSEDEALRNETLIALRESAGEPIATLLPFGPSESLESVLTPDTDFLFMQHMLSIDRLGPPIEIYALR